MKINMLLYDTHTLLLELFCWTKGYDPVRDYETIITLLYNGEMADLCLLQRISYHDSKHMNHPRSCRLKDPNLKCTNSSGLLSTILFSKLFEW